MAVSIYLEKPTQWQCVQWNGGNSADVSTVLSSVGWSWTTDSSNNGTAHTPFGGSVAVAMNTWVIAGNGSPQFLDNTTFGQQFTQGSTWQVVP